MKRTKNDYLKYPPDFILWSDVHIMEKNPVARLDLYTEVIQWKKLLVVKELQKQFGCPVLCGGDLFDKWKVSPELLSKTMKYLPKNLYTVYGQHELPEHNLSLAYKSATHTLETSGHLKIVNPASTYFAAKEANSKSIKAPFHTVNGASWGEDLPTSLVKNTQQRLIGVMHRFVWEEKEVFSQDNTRAINILKKYPMYDLILTGDNHKPFVVEYKGRLLVNPGSFFRITAGQINHRPRVYLYYAEPNTVYPYYIPINENAVSREHLEEKEERKQRVGAFIAGWDTDLGDSVNFEKNLKTFLEKNLMRREVKEIINKVI